MMQPRSERCARPHLSRQEGASRRVLHTGDGSRGDVVAEAPNTPSEPRGPTKFPEDAIDLTQCDASRAAPSRSVLAGAENRRTLPKADLDKVCAAAESVVSSRRDQPWIRQRMAQDLVDAWVDAWMRGVVGAAPPPSPNDARCLVQWLRTVARGRCASLSRGSLEGLPRVLKDKRLERPSTPSFSTPAALTSTQHSLLVMAFRGEPIAEIGRRLRRTNSDVWRLARQIGTHVVRERKAPGNLSPRVLLRRT